MLRTNLATRPFYNERPVHAAILLVALLVGALTAFNVWELVALSGRDAALGGQVQQAEAAAARLRQDAARARASVDREQLDAVLTASREANILIGQRVFSWTQLLNQLEQTLPRDVRIRSINPTTDEDAGLSIQMVVLARRAEDVEAFVNNLEGTGAFHGVFASVETTNEAGLLEVTLGGRYGETPGAAPADAAGDTPAVPPGDVRNRE